MASVVGEGTEVREEEENLREIINLLKLDFHKLTDAIDFNTENARQCRPVLFRHV